LFYRCSHRILLDIGVGASCTAALVAFALHAFWTPDAVFRRRYLVLFHVGCLFAFLSKGVVGLVHIAVPIATFCLFTRLCPAGRAPPSPAVAADLRGPDRTLDRALFPGGRARLSGAALRPQHAGAVLRRPAGPPCCRLFATRPRKGPPLVLLSRGPGPDARRL